MAHFAKILGFASLAALMAAPVCAAPAHSGAGRHTVALRPPLHGSPGLTPNRARRNRSNGDSGFLDGFGLPVTTYTNAAPDYPEPYGGYDEPAGYGVIYNRPPARPPVLMNYGAHIITLSGRHFHHRPTGRPGHLVIVRRGVIELR